MNTKILLMVLFLFLIAEQEAYSQLGFSHEVGILAGPVAFYSDYGVRNDFETNSKNVGIGIGLIHYLNFAYSASCNCYTRESYFNDHFKIRNEIDYHKTNLRHYGEWVERSSDGAAKLRGMSGSTSVVEIGSQLEWYPLSIRDFDAGAYKISPFISLGMHWVNFSPSAKTSYGTQDVSNPNDIIPKYINAFQQEAGSTWAIVGSIGFRYKLTKMSDLMLDSRWQYYFNDYVDGLNPSLKNNGTVRVPENKSNDWIYWLNVGYIYYIN